MRGVRSIRYDASVRVLPTLGQPEVPERFREIELQDARALGLIFVIVVLFIVAIAIIPVARFALTSIVIRSATVCSVRHEVPQDDGIGSLGGNDNLSGRARVALEDGVAPRRLILVCGV